MTDDDFRIMCARFRVRMDDSAKVAALRAWAEFFEPELRRVYEDCGFFAAAKWCVDVHKELEKEGASDLAEFLAGLLSLWEDEEDRVRGGDYSRIEYQRRIDGVESGKVPDSVWLYRFWIDRIEGLGIDDQVRSIINKLKEEHNFTSTSIAHAVGMDETSLSKFLNGEQSLDLRSIDLIVRHFAIVLMPLAWTTEIPYSDMAAGRRKGRNDKGKKRRDKPLN